MKGKYRFLLGALVAGWLFVALLAGGGQGARATVTTCDPCSDGIPVFGPETFQRISGTPVTDVRQFEVPEDREVCVSVVNNGCEAAWVEVNGVEVINPVVLKSDLPVYQTNILMPQGWYRLSVRLGSASGCSIDLTLRACLPLPCSEVATAWCEAKGWSVAVYTDGAVVCTAPGYDEYAHCDECNIYNLVVYEDLVGDPLCSGGHCTTYAGHVYGGHDPCECGDNLRYCGPWDMQGCIPD